MPLVTVILACNISNQRHLSCGVGITEDRRKGCRDLEMMSIQISAISQVKAPVVPFYG